MPSNPSLSRPTDRARVEARLRKMVERWPRVSGCLLQPDPTIVEGILQALVRSTMQHGLGYCPCRDLTGDPVVDRANICPCAHHAQEIAAQGHCRCQLFVSAAYDPAIAYRPEPATIQQRPLRSVRHRWVTVYTTHWCYLSRRTKALLDTLGIPYEDVNIEQDPEAAQRVEAWNGGFRSVPTVVARMVITEPTTSELATVLQTPSALLDALCVNVTQWCALSRRTLAWLRENGVPHVSVDIEQDPEAARRVSEWNRGYQSVPTLDLTLRITEPTSDELVRMLGLGMPR
ncbi:MAG TPA: hypothetical protein GX714_00155 [Chloroflexi bacterium]|jgi:ferredoxin-thioredoxin reductase catalytic subunit/glutaredoxin|nr:hypothetical protein [Chloroflexota bacterium]